MARFAINANARKTIKGITVETLTILGWTVGSALHSIFTKKSLNKLPQSEPIASRIIYGSFLTIIQLLIAASTGILICGVMKIFERERKYDENSVIEANLNEIVHSENNINNDGSVTESTCENKLEQTEGTQLSLISSYIINDNNSNCDERNNEFNDEYADADLNCNIDENCDIKNKEMNKDYHVNKLTRYNYSSVILEMASIYEKKCIKNKINSIESHDEQNIGFDYRELENKRRWWGSNELLFSAALYAIANICANTALGGGKVMLVQIIKCSELILTAILAFFVLKRKVTIREVIAFSISTIGIILVVTSTLSSGNSNSKAVIYSVILASIGAFTISLRNVIVSSANKNEKAVDTFTILSFWGMITSLAIFTIMSISFKIFYVNVPILPLMISGCFHATYNFSSLAFLKLVGSPIVHAYFNLAKRAIIVLTAELINCTTPPPVQIVGSILAILGIHFSKKTKIKKKKEKPNLEMEKDEMKYGNNIPLEKVIREKPKESKFENKDKYPYAASIAFSGLFIIIGWATSYTYSCVLPINGKTSVVS